MAEYIVNLDCFEPVNIGDVNAALLVHEKVERIVRCKDCKYFEKGNRSCWCYRHADWCFYPDVSPDGFCAWGEPKEA